MGNPEGKNRSEATSAMVETANLIMRLHEVMQKLDSSEKENLRRMLEVAIQDLSK